ncbi:treslin-like [Octopus sinensis]|uniref:Treslin-like n=1 Tax=Octopus sinensis TaxID=2607531 RepID=A0A6P7TT46_9MOLL|nr:treslin-like [Octopus sinensis]
MDKHNEHSLDKRMSPFEFVVENPEKLPSNSSASTSKNKFLTRSTQQPLSLQMEIYGYLETSDLNNCSDHVFFCTPLSEHLTSYPTSSTHIKQSLRTAHKGTSPKKNIKERASSKIALFQNLLHSLTKTNFHLMVQIKIDEETTPYIGVLEPITINLAAVTILPMGLNRQLKELFPVFPVYGHCSNSKISSACDFDKLDSVLQRYSTKIMHSKHFTKDQSDKTIPESTFHSVFDSSILNKWTIPNAENPEMTKMSKLFCKKQLHTKEIELLKKLKQLYRKADSPSRLVDKGLVDEKPSKPDTNQATESISQKADNLKPCLLKKLRSFTLGPTRAEMILYKSMAVAEELNKTESEEPVSCLQENEDSKQILDEVNTLVKCITNNNDLIDFVNQSYATSLQEKLDPWKQIYQVVNVVLNYLKPHNTDNPETETKKFLLEHLYVSCSDLRHKYKKPELEKETKIQEYKLQIILRMEIQCLQLVSDKTETLDTKDDAHSMEACVEDVVTMLRTLSFISDLTLLPFFLRDVLLKNYSHSIPQVVANIYDELMQPVPSVLADVMSPESDAPSTLCPSSVSSFTVDESLREFLPNAVQQTQTKKSKTKQVLPGLGERLNRQIIVGKKSNTQAIKKRLSKSKSSSSDKKRTGVVSSSKDTVRARRSLFTSDSRKLERHRSFAVTEREKSRAHRRHTHHKDSGKNKRRKTVVAETPAHKQVSQVMRRWHLLQSRLTEPLEVLAKGQSNTDHNLPLESKSSRLVIEESPLKEIQSSKLSSSECNHKTKVLIRKGFYGLSRNRLQSRNFAKYMGLADRIAGRHDRYAKLTTTSTSFTENNASSRSPLDQPNTFALSQLMGFPSPSTPKFDNTSITSNYTPNPKSEAFPFSRSPVIRKRSLDKPLVKQALFTTPEKISMQSSSTAHCSGDKQSKSNKLALEKSENSIFQTPTKEAPHCLETPEKSVITPENIQLNNFNESKVIENVSIVTRNKSCTNNISHESQRFIATSGTLKKTPVKRRNDVHETSSVISQPKSNSVSGEEDASHRNSVSTSLNLPTKVLQTPSPKPSVQSSTPDSLDKWKRKKYYYCNKEKSSNICHSSSVSNQGVADKSNRCLRLDTDYETFLDLLGNKHSKRKAGVDSNGAGFLTKRRRYNN